MHVRCGVSLCLLGSGPEGVVLPHRAHQHANLCCTESEIGAAYPSEELIELPVSTDKVEVVNGMSNQASTVTRPCEEEDCLTPGRLSRFSSLSLCSPLPIMEHKQEPTTACIWRALRCSNMLRRSCSHASRVGQTSSSGACKLLFADCRRNHCHKTPSAVRLVPK